MFLKTYFEWVKSFSAGLLGAALFIGVYQVVHSCPKLAMVNVNRLVKEHIKTRATSELSSEELERDAQKFMKKLEQALQELSRRHHLSLIVSEAVIVGPKDYTEVIKQQMEKSN